MKLKLFSFLLLAASLCGCKAILKKSMGITNPKIETPESLQKKAKRFGLNPEAILTVDETQFQAVTKFAQNVPEAAIFDANGAYIEYRQTDTSCNAGLFDFIPALHPDSTYRKTGLTTLAAEMPKLRTIRGEKLGAWEAQDADFYVLIYWAAWAGKLNKDHVRVWADAAAANTKSHIRVYLVSLDIQSYWSESFKKALLTNQRNR